MAHPETASRPAVHPLWRRTGVFTYPGFEASQPAAGTVHALPSLPPQGTSADIRPSLHSVPQPWLWHYYDPTRHPSHLQATPLSSPMSGPHPPSITAPINPMLDPLLASLAALQSQFTSFQEGLGNVKSDVKDALVQLHALRTAQNKTDKSIAELEAVIGVSAGARPGGRAGRGQGRGGRAEPAPQVEGPDAGTAPEKTLIQSLASIQSAIDELRPLCSNATRLPVYLTDPSVIHRASAALPSPFPPSANPMGQESCQTSPSPISVVDPAQYYATSHSTQLAPATLSTPPSGISSPFSSAVTPTVEFEASPLPAAAGKENVDASVQACPLSNSGGHVHWNVDPATPRQSADNSTRQTTHTAEYLVQFSPDTHLSATNIATDRQTPLGINDYPLRNSTSSYTQLPTRTMSSASLPSCPIESIADNSIIRQARSTNLPTASNSPTTPVVPSASSTAPATVTSPSSTRASIRALLPQSPSHTTEGADSSMTLPGMGSSGDLRASSSSPDSLSSISDPPISISGPEERVGCPVRSHTELDKEDVQMTSDTDGNRISGTGGVSKPVPTGHQSPPIEADDGELPSGLPTPPLEMFADDRESRIVSRFTRGCGAVTDSEMNSSTHRARNFPAIPTPPRLTPEPSVGDQDPGQGLARQGSLRAISEPLSFSTPLVLSPSPAAGSSLAEEVSSDTSRQVGAQKAVEKHTDSTDDVRPMVVCGGSAIEGVNADTPTNDASSRLQTKQVAVEEYSLAMNLAVPAPTVIEDAQMNDARSSSQTERMGVEESTSATQSGGPAPHEPQSIVVSNGDSSQVPRAAGDVDLPMTPRSLVGRPDTGLPEHHPDANDIGPAYSPTNEYTFGFSSPLRHPSPPAPATPSRYATPSDSPDPRFTQDEDEVWSALVLGASGMSTPVPDSTSLLLMSLHRPSPASSVHPHTTLQHSTSTLRCTKDASVDHASSTSALELLAVDPSILHDPLPLPYGPGLQNSPQASQRSLSSLTSLADTDVDDPNVAQRGKKPRTSAPVNKDRARGSSNRGRRSEPYLAPPPSRALGLPSLPSVVRGTTETMAVGGRASSRLLGGPDASLDELAVLARRKPLKIHLKIPETMRSLKRKRDAVDGEGAEAGREREATDGDLEQEQREAISTEDSATVPPRPRERTSAPTMPTRRTPENSANSGLMESPDEHPDMPPVSRKRTKKQSERGGKKPHGTRTTSEHAHIRQQILKRGPNPKPQSPIKFHFRHGQIVSVESGREPTPEPRHQAPVTSPTSQPSIHDKEAGEDSQTPTRVCHRKGQDNEAMETPLSSPVKPPHPTPRLASPSPTKEDARDTTSQDDTTWPELPSMFSHWHAQFIQCDNCDMWYHYGCVAIKSGDPRLEPAVLFICPTCDTQSASYQTLRNHDTCARPDCPEPHITGDSELFFVEKLVGRKKIEGYIYMWLAKWEGFPTTQATWIPKENVIGDGTKLCNAFLKDAVKECADLTQDVVLLQEALEAGWEAY